MQLHYLDFDFSDEESGGQVRGTTLTLYAQRFARGFCEAFRDAFQAGSPTS